MPYEVSRAGAGHDREPTVEDLKRNLAAARQREAATAEILRVISKTRTDIQPVFDTIVKSVVRLCNGLFSGVYRFDGELLHHVAHYNYAPAALAEVKRKFPTRPARDFGTGRAILECATIHIPDVEVDPEYRNHPLSRAVGMRSGLFVPMLRDGAPVGAIAVARAEPGPFSDNEIELLKSFADQAVIAIENTQLFEAEQSSKRELQESLEYQTAISELLAVISRSPNELQPVFDFIARSASTLCGNEHAIVTRYDGELVHLVAQHNPRPGAFAETASFYPLLADPRASVAVRAMVTATIVHIPDIECEDYEPSTLERYRRMSARAFLAVPIMHQGRPIGSVGVSRATLGPFSDRQIDLLKTFAAQAVIAIENTRLFEEVQARTRELAEALDYQLATGEVLSVISRSQTDVQRAFRAILDCALRFCSAEQGGIFTVKDGQLAPVEISPNTPEVWAAIHEGYPRPIDLTSLNGRALMERRVIHVPDTEDAAALPSANLVRRLNLRALLSVPLLRSGEPIGVLTLQRQEPGPYSDRQIALVKTFADQAVIAIENTRLFEAEQARTREVETKSVELAQSLEYQTATSGVLAVISRSKFDLQPIIDTIVETATSLCEAERGALMRFENGCFRLLPTTGAMTGPVTKRLADRLLPIDRGSVTGRVAIERRTVHILDLQADPEFTLMRGTEGDDRRTCLGVPLIAGNGLLGALVLQRTEVLPFTQEQIKLVETFADQAVIAFENTRLFDEIVSKSRELEIASQHKSQFVANMSHELRTPLAAILGYAELMQEGFYEPQGPKSLDALTRIRSNGKHLLGLINTVLDIAKIESGQFSLNLGEYAIENVVETVRVATEALAQTKKLTLTTEVAKSLPIAVGDEQRLTQVLLNLVGNAIKFTDVGEVRVTAKAVNGHFNVSVADTGPGIPEQERTRIFEQFHQIDNSNTKAKGGTGLGLAIAKQIVEMHGGRIWVESALGKGSIFQLELPTRADFRRA